MESPALSRPMLNRWTLTGTGLIACMLAVALISPGFVYGGDKLTRPTIPMTALLVSCGFIYLIAVTGVQRSAPNLRLLGWMLGVGLTLRLLLFFSTPICETDFYRYLWDGGVTANGHNPFAWSPNEVIEAKAGDEVPEALLALAAKSEGVIDRVNHAKLGSIYPPVAQGAFALAYTIKPWSLAALRFVLFTFDAATLVLLLIILRHLKLPLLLGAVYWWNPIVIKETANSAHMDVIVLPFVLGGLLLAARKRPVVGAAVLGLAAGTKIWPVILLPLVLRPLLSSPRRLVLALLAFAVVVGVQIPMVLGAARLADESGFVAYGREWEMNDAFYVIVEWLIRAVASGASNEAVHMAGRLAVGVLLVAFIAWFSWRPASDERDFFTRALYIVAAAFLLGPTQFPWYYIWMVPLLAVRPRVSLLLLSALLPIYYMRFYFVARDNVDVFDYGLVWLEFVPVWCLLLWEVLKARRPMPVACPAESG